MSECRLEQLEFLNSTQAFRVLVDLQGPFAACHQTGSRALPEVSWGPGTPGIAFLLILPPISDLRCLAHFSLCDLGSL